MTGFICHDDYMNKTSKLSDEELGRLFRACMKYHATGEEQDLDGRESIAFDFIREDIDRSEKAYQTKCEINRKNRLSKMTNDDEHEQSSTVDDERGQPSIRKEKEKEKENKNKKERMTPPTREEVAAFCADNGLTIDVDRFMNYYESNGWKVGRNPMKNWQATVRNWAKEKAPPGKIVSAQAYSQRDYADVQKELMEEQAREMEQFMLRGAG